MKSAAFYRALKDATFCGMLNPYRQKEGMG